MPDEEVKPEEVKPAPEKPKPDVVHVGMTEEQVDAKMRKVRDELSELHAGDKAEREELKVELAELREYKEKQEQAQAERDKVESSQHTMVLPPNDIPPQQPSPPPNTHPGVEGNGRKGKWKSLW